MRETEVKGHRLRDSLRWSSKGVGGKSHQRCVVLVGWGTDRGDRVG